MKGFPNQVNDLRKLAIAMRCIVSLVDRGEQAKDNLVLGEELVRAGVVGPGRKRMPIEDYLKQQRGKRLSNQSPRATAKGLRELFRLLGFIDDSGDTIVVTESGRQAAAFADAPESAERIPFWRRSISEMTHFGKDATASHPYLVLLRLIALKPDISKAKLPLALEAKDDSQSELDRIVRLSELGEAQIIRRLHITKPNWDNAGKVLPGFAEQLADVIHKGDSYRIADAPRRVSNIPAKDRGTTTSRASRTSRSVTPTTIGQAGTADNFDEVTIHADVDQATADAAIDTCRRRLRQHNLLLRKLASRLWAAGAALNEGAFDVFALVGTTGILGEVKTLDGTAPDERDRVRDALSQLLYYRAFLLPPAAGAADIRMVACFTQKIREDHACWLNAQGIAVIWEVNDRFAGDLLAAEFLGPYIEELR